MDENFLTRKHGNEYILLVRLIVGEPEICSHRIIVISKLNSDLGFRFELYRDSMLITRSIIPKAKQINIFVSVSPGQEVFAHAGGREIILYWTDFPPANIGVFFEKSHPGGRKTNII